MHKSIFLLAGLFLLGSVSVVQCYSDQSDEDFEEPLSRGAAKEEECEEEGEVHSAGAVCSKCKPGQICTPPDVCRCPTGRAEAPCEIQSAGLCSSAATKYSPIVKSIDFGSGSSQYSTASLSSLGFSSNYKRVVSSKEKVPDGSFAIVNKLPQDFVTWLGGGPGDHSSSNHQGYMMLVNAAYGKGNILEFKVNDLIVGLRYEFSANFANVNKKGSNIILPDVILEARTATSDHTLIASTPTGKIAEESQFTWKRYGMSFIAPTREVVLSLNSKAGGGGGDDYVVDDITVVPCQPVDNVVCSGKK